MKQLLPLLLAGTLAASALAQTGTTFTYQGELKEGGSAAIGPYNLQVSLWNAVAGGSQIGSTIALDGVSVDHGMFTVQLDFGAAAFDNSGRWLEIVVEGFTLFPRPPVTRSPYSIQTRGIFVDDAGRVGIGTTTPTDALQVEASSGTAISGHSTPSSGATIGVSGQTDSTTGAGVYGFASTGTGLNYGVYGRSNSATGSGVYGRAALGNGNSYGVFGQSQSTTGTGVYGWASSPTGTPKGVRGACSSPNGFAGFFEGRGYFSQSLGIGTSSPGTLLDVAGDANVRRRLGIGDPTSLFGQLTVVDSGNGSVFAIDAEWDSNDFPAIFATNSGTGGVLWASGQSDVTPSGGGIVVVGDPNGASIGIDNNEIMARDSGQPSDLYLNADGGTLHFGAYRMHPAYAYATIRENGSILSASSNVTSVTVTGTGFLVTLADGVAATDIIIASDAYYLDGADDVTATPESGRIRIGCHNDNDGWHEAQVSFVVYRP
ncbi:MAG: hypothetical protein IPJ41_00370 [Phycisphaerales bacterium]|nr:hypothetical protein [Phycisphaerales bacterium]